MAINKTDTEPDYRSTIKELSRLEGMLDLYLNKLKKSNDAENGAESRTEVLDGKMAEEMSDRLKLLDQKLLLLDQISGMTDQIASLNTRLDILDDMDESTRFIRDFTSEKLNVNFNAMYDNIMDQMNVEAIKIYRNLQAVIVEENAKQNNVMFGMEKKTEGLKKRMNHVLFFSVVSFIVSIFLIILQILPAFGIHLF